MGFAKLISQGFGLMLEIAETLVKEVTSLGGSEDDVRQILTDAKLRSDIAQLIMASGSRKLALSWVPDWHPIQKDGGTIQGHELRMYYDGPQFVGRHLSLESPLVRGWRANPETYPEELKDKRVYLWGSRRRFGHDDIVSCVYINNGKITVAADSLSFLWDGSSPALLAGTPASPPTLGYKR